MLRKVEITFSSKSPFGVTLRSFVVDVISFAEDVISFVEDVIGSDWGEGAGRSVCSSDVKLLSGSIVR